MPTLDIAVIGVPTMRLDHSADRQRLALEDVFPEMGAVDVQLRARRRVGLGR